MPKKKKKTLFVKRIKKSDAIKIAITLLVLSLIPITVFLVKQQSRLSSKADNQAPELFFVPSTLQFVSLQPVKLMMDTKGESIVFTDIKLTYDSRYLKLRTTPIPSSLFGRTIEITPDYAANADNKATIAIAVNPNQRPVNGLIEIASFSVGVNVAQLTSCSQLSIDPNNSRVVTENAVSSNITVRPTTVCASLSPTPTPVPITPTPVPQTPTPQPTLRPTPIPQPTTTPKPTPYKQCPAWTKDSRNAGKIQKICQFLETVCPLHKKCEYYMRCFCK